MDHKLSLTLSTASLCFVSAAAAINLQGSPSSDDGQAGSSAAKPLRRLAETLQLDWLRANPAETTVWLPGGN